MFSLLGGKSNVYEISPSITLKRFYCGKVETLCKEIIHSTYSTKSFILKGEAVVTYFWVHFLNIALIHTTGFFVNYCCFVHSFTRRR